jgi:hydrogenase expression/formation protein HypE
MENRKIPMKKGKIPEKILKQMVFDKIKNKRDEVLLRPGVGEDCCGVDLGDNITVLTSDPVTGAINDAGRIAVIVSCNDIASCGAEPVGILVTLLLPEGTCEETLENIMKQISETADSLNVDIIGGHTEVTDAVNKNLIVCTAVGSVSRNKLVRTSGGKPGDKIIMTKTAGLEGTAILAADYEDRLSREIGTEAVKRAKKFINDISVVKEGLIAGKFGVSAMHDVTEGGILGALWELCQASGTGIMVYEEKIPVADETKIICDVFNMDPLKLISSGSMLIACKEGEALVKELELNGIKATIIGLIRDDEKREMLSKRGIFELEPPLPDELYKK